METPRTATITMRVRNALKKRLEKMARTTGRSRSFFATQAIARFRCIPKPPKLDFGQFRRPPGERYLAG